MAGSARVVRFANNHHGHHEWPFYYTNNNMAGSMRTKMAASSDIMECIVKQLRANNGPMETLEIARSLGLRTRKEVNPTLYKMFQQGNILKISDSPPKWGLKHEVILGHNAAPYRPQDASAKNGDCKEHSGANVKVRNHSVIPDIEFGHNEERLNSDNTVLDKANNNSNRLVGSNGMEDERTVEYRERFEHEDRMDDEGTQEISMEQSGEFLSVPGGGRHNSIGRSSSSSDEGLEEPEAGNIPSPAAMLDFLKPNNVSAAAPENSLNNQLLTVLKGKTEAIHSNDLAKLVGLRSKKEINPTLFAMQRQGLVRKVSESPPLWVITPYGRQLTNGDDSKVAFNPGFHANNVRHNNRVPPRFGQSNKSDPSMPPSTQAQPLQQLSESAMNHKATMNAKTEHNLRLQFQNAQVQGKTFHNSKSSKNGNLEIPILQAVSNGEAFTTVDIARSIGLRTAKDVNPTIYSLSKQGMMEKLQDVPPVWKITNQGKAHLQSFPGQVQGPPNRVMKPAEFIQQNYQMWNQNATTQADFNMPSNVALEGAIPQGLEAESNRPTWGVQSVQQPQQQQQQQQQQQSAGAGVVGNGSSAGAATGSGGSSGGMPMDPMTLLHGSNAKKPQNSATNFTLESIGATTINQPPAMASQNASGAGAALNNEMFAAINKNPVSALTEYAQSRHLPMAIDMVHQTGPPHNPRFTFRVQVGGRTFPAVTSRAKKDGKREAADVALRVLVAEGAYQPSVSQAASLPVQLSSGNGTTFYDRIAGLSHQAFNTLAAGIPESISGRKVLAALIMKRSESDEGSVICLGTGNRCVTGDMLSLEGQTVNDSHAEIITRRAFLKFMYKQLAEYKQNPEQTIFQEAPSGKLGLKPEVTFHLYISTAPCGDGAQFSRTDAGDNAEGPAGQDFTGASEHKPTFGKNIQGLLRTKMEFGEGTIPVDSSSNTVQTWDGIMRGCQRLRTMSCSDKVARWNIIGLQGALLSFFVEPIYLSSLTLGSLYHHGHLARAVCCRLNHASETKEISQSLPAPYRVNHPQLGCVTAIDPPRGTEKTKALSINWFSGCQGAEVTDGTKGRIHGVSPSQLCKAAMFTAFRQVCELYGRQDLLEVKSYHEAKEKAEQFSLAKKHMKECFKKGGYGVWVEKPIEEELFL